MQVEFIEGNYNTQKPGLLFQQLKDEYQTISPKRSLVFAPGSDFVSAVMMQSDEISIPDMYFLMKRFSESAGVDFCQDLRVRISAPYKWESWKVIPTNIPPIVNFPIVAQMYFPKRVSYQGQVEQMMGIADRIFSSFPVEEGEEAIFNVPKGHGHVRAKFPQVIAIKGWDKFDAKAIERFYEEMLPFVVESVSGLDEPVTWMQVRALFPIENEALVAVHIYPHE